MGVALVAAAAASALLYWLPATLRTRATAELAQRSGLDVRVGVLEVGLGQLSIDRVDFGTPNTGLEVNIEDLQVDFDVAGVVLDGANGVQQVRVGAVKGRIDATAPGFEAWLSRVRHRVETPERATTGEARPRRKLPVLSVAAASVAVADRHGPLAAAEVDEIRMDAEGRFSVLVPRCSGGTNIVQARDVALSGRVESGSVVLGSADVGSWSVNLRQLAPAPPAGGDRKVRHEGQPDQSTAEPGLLTRFRTLAARATTVQQPGPSSAAGKRSAKERTAENAGPTRWFGPDARVEAGTGTIGRPGTATPRLAEVSFSAQRSGGSWTVRGTAQSALGGEIDVDMKLKEAPLTADGRVDVTRIPLAALAPFVPSIPFAEPVQGNVDAQLVVRSDSVERIALSGRVDVRGAAFEHPRIAATPVNDVHVRLEGRGALLPLARRLEVTEGAVVLGEVPVAVQGALELGAEHYVVDATARLERTPCDVAVTAIPADLLGDLVHASFDGVMSAGLRLKLDSRALDETELDIDFTDRCEFRRMPAFVDLRRFREPFVHTVAEGDGSFFEFETGPGTVHWTYLEDISPLLVHAVLAHEDGRFFDHQGFSPPHIRRALVRNLREGRYVVGASTITMQLVKNIFLRREKTLARKTQEVLLTWWIERVMEKRDILELYLNVIEYGPSVYGIRDAAQYYFKRLPSDLSPAEAVYISTILPNPKAYHVQYENGRISERWADRMRKILARLRARHRYSEAVADYGVAELGQFRFYKEGEHATARQVPQGVASLPYMIEGLSGWDAADYALPSEPQGFDEID